MIKGVELQCYSTNMLITNNNNNDKEEGLNKDHLKGEWFKIVIRCLYQKNNSSKGAIHQFYLEINKIHHQ